MKALLPHRLAAVAAVCVVFVHAAAPAAAAPPNLVVILADDLGWSDVGCYGGEIPTPHLDALAAGGMRFTAFYNCAQCCPTRAALLSGMDPHAAGMGDMIDGFAADIRRAAASPHYTTRLDPRALTIAERLRPAGYRTLMTGKWHVGFEDGARPLQRGFDRFYGFVGGGDDYFRPRRLVDGDARVPTESLPADFYATDAFTTKAMEFIAEEDAGKPFFLYLAYNAPHARLMAPEQEIARQRGRYDAGFEAVAERRLARQKELGLVPADMRLPPRDPGSKPWSGTPAQLTEMRNMEVYAAMVARLDANIGRLVAFLEERGELDDTLILFLSDNGAWASGATYEQEWAETCDTPLRLFKLFTHEGGIRTPLIAHWPGRIRPGTVQSRHYAHVKDILPTLLEAAGAAPRDAAEPGPPSLPVTGRSFLPALLDPTHAAPETLCWERLGNEAVRDGRWKLVRAYSAVRNYNPVTKRGPGDGPRTGRWELYDLEADPGESCDLAAAEPERVAELAARYARWAEEVGVVPRERIAAAVDAAAPAGEPQAQPPLSPSRP